MRKLVTILSIVITMLGAFSVSTFAKTSDINNISKILEDKTIENYGDILNGIKGFTNTLKTTDDLKTLKFGKGEEIYTIDYTKLEKNPDLKITNDNMEDLIVPMNSFIFPILVENRVVASVRVDMDNGKYKVVETSSLPENGYKIEASEKKINEIYINKNKEVKYIQAMPYFEGYRIKTPTDNNMVSITNYGTIKKEQFKPFSSVEVLNEIKQKHKEFKSSGEANLGGGGLSPEKNSNNITYIIITGVSLLLIISATIFIRKRNTITN